MTTIETVKYQNDYTGEMFDSYEECFDSEAKFLFSEANTGIITVLDGGRIGDIIEAFDGRYVNGLTLIELMLLSSPQQRRPMPLLTTSSLIGMKQMGLNLNLLTLMFVTINTPTLSFLFRLLTQMTKTTPPSLVRQKQT